MFCELLALVILGYIAVRWVVFPLLVVAAGLSTILVSTLTWPIRHYDLQFASLADNRRRPLPKTAARRSIHLATLRLLPLLTAARTVLFATHEFLAPALLVVIGVTFSTYFLIGYEFDWLGATFAQVYIAYGIAIAHLVAEVTHHACERVLFEPSSLRSERFNKRNYFTDN